MYAFTDDKSKWNLGYWGGFAVNREAFKIGALSNNTKVANAFPDKYVAEVPVNTLNVAIQHALGESWTPLILMTETCGSITSSTAIIPVRDDEKKGFEVIEGVYSQNQTLYFVAKSKPFKELVFVIKGA